MEATNLKKKLDFPVNFLKIGKKTYALKEVCKEGINIEDEVKEFYESKYKIHVEDFNDVVSGTMENEWNTLASKIQRHSQKSSIAIPPNMQFLPVTCIGTRVIPLRTVIYEPTEMKCCIYNLDLSSMGHLKDEVESMRNLDRNTVLIIKFKPTVRFPILVGYCGKTDQLYIPFSTTAHSFPGGNVCLGNSKAHTYWSMSDETLGIELSKINLFSPASRVIAKDDNGEYGTYKWEIKDIVTKDTIISVQEEVGAWQPQ